MKTSSKAEIREELRKSLRGNRIIAQRYNQLIKALRKRDQALVADALIDFLCDCDEYGWAAKDLAGKLLLELNPEPGRPLAEILRRSLPKWDASVEEYPFYLARQFGEPQLRIALAEFKKNADEHLLPAAETFEWWLGWLDRFPIPTANR